MGSFVQLIVMLNLFLRAYILKLLGKVEFASFLTRVVDLQSKALSSVLSSFSLPFSLHSLLNQNNQIATLLTPQWGILTFTIPIFLINLAPNQSSD